MEAEFIGDLSSFKVGVKRQPETTIGSVKPFGLVQVWI